MVFFLSSSSGTPIIQMSAYPYPIWESPCVLFGGFFFFPLAAFNICSLCLIFVKLINMCFGVFRLGFILFETLGFLD